jgi:hypothetical protein
MMDTSLDFEAFWILASSQAQSRNTLAYHQCCDVWTTRNSKKARNSHKQITHWIQVMLSLDRSVPDKKQALLAKLTEERRRTTVLMNLKCFASLNYSHRPRDSHQPLETENSIEGLQVPEPQPYFPLSEGKECKDQGFSRFFIMN